MPRRPRTRRTVQPSPQVITIRTIEDLQNVPRDADGNLMLQHADLRRAVLRDAILTGANLYYANLEQADLTGAHLERANLVMATLSGTNLRNAHLEHARLINTNAYEANLTGAFLQNADFGTDASISATSTTQYNNQTQPEALRNRLRAQGAINTDEVDPNALPPAQPNEPALNLEMTRAIMANAINRLTANRMAATNAPTRLTATNVPNRLTDEQIQTNIAAAHFVPTGSISQTSRTGRAFEIHNVSAYFNSNPNFSRIIGINNRPIISTVNFVELRNLFIEKINNMEISSENKRQLITKLRRVFDRLASCREPIDADFANAIHKSVEFAFRQDPSFIEAYITVYIDETTRAYNNQTAQANLSCIKGMKERFYTSLLPAALQVDTIEGYVKSDAIRDLICIAKTGKTQKDPNEIIQEWSEEWQRNPNKVSEWRALSFEQRKQHLRDFMLSKYREDECYEMNAVEVQNIINTAIPDAMDYVFDQDNQVPDEDIAQFGGILSRKRRRTIKRRHKKSKSKKNRGRR